MFDLISALTLPCLTCMFLHFDVRREQRPVWNILSERNAEAHVWNTNIHLEGPAAESQAPCEAGGRPEDKPARAPPDLAQYFDPTASLQSQTCANCCLSHALQVRQLQLTTLVSKTCCVLHLLFYSLSHLSTADLYFFSTVFSLYFYIF